MTFVKNEINTIITVEPYPITALENFEVSSVSIRCGSANISILFDILINVDTFCGTEIPQKPVGLLVYIVICRGDNPIHRILDYGGDSYH